VKKKISMLDEYIPKTASNVRFRGIKTGQMWKATRLVDVCPRQHDTVK
jgi:hypothetical protein